MENIGKSKKRFSRKSVLVSSLSIAVIFVFGIISVRLFEWRDLDMMENEKHGNLSIVSEQKKSIFALLERGKYRCCMKEPCSRCFAKKENHEKEAVCDCLDDLVNGVHPCGECIGEILEGEGNPLLAEYFASSIAEKLGKEHITTLKNIIFEQYGIDVSEQL